MKKIFSLLLLVSGIISFVFAEAGNKTQIIQAGSRLYDDMYVLCMETKNSSFIENQPMSVGELQFYLSRIDYDDLSDAGKKVYDRVSAQLNTTTNFFPSQEFRLYSNILVNPEVYYKSNPNIDWSINRYLNGYLLTVPIILGWSDYVTIETDVFLGKNVPAVHEPDNWTNVPPGGNELEFDFPRFAYGSTGLTFDKWGVSFHAGKEGVSTGNTKLGSIIQNDTFETDFYSQLSLYSDYLKYTMSVTQVDPTKYLYLHQLDLRPFKCFKLSIIEGSLLNAPFELRYLNPFMIMHSFGSWEQYQLSTVEEELYGEGHFCAYLCFSFEWMPLRNFRVYGLYAQNEILDMGGSRTDSALSVPDSLGFQLGLEYNWRLPNAAYLKTNLEGIYTSPYLYVKHSKDWSLFRERKDMHYGEVVQTWLGSPFGPDCFALQLYAEYEPVSNWRLSAGYLFKLHGENTSELFGKKVAYTYTDDEGNEATDYVYTYYPSVQYKIAENNQDQKEMDAARDKGRYMWMTGTVEQVHQIAVKISYSILKNLQVNGLVSYSLVLNSNNISGNTQQGVEFGLGCEYRLLK